MRCHSKLKFPASTLPAAMVAALLLLLTGAGVLMLWETDFQGFARLGSQAQDEENIRSSLTLYSTHPEIVLDCDEVVGLQLFDSLERSAVSLKRSRLGLYERLTVTSGNSCATYVLGLREPKDNPFTFYTRDRGGAVNLASNSGIMGRMALPRNGVSYNAVDGVNFCGEKVDLNGARLAQRDITPPDAGMEAIAGGLLDGRDRGRIVIEGQSGKDGLIQSGTNTGTMIKDSVITADVIEVREGARIEAQLFAMDSVIIKSGAVLEYPSGVYCRGVVIQEDGSEVNGYVIMPQADDNDSGKQPYFRMGKDAVVRGLLYVDGSAQLGGEVSGAAYVGQLVYDSKRGRYSNVLFDASIVENRNVAYPLWLSANGQRRTMKTVPYSRKADLKKG